MKLMCGQVKKNENKGTFIALRMLETIVNNEMQDTFPNMYICLRIYLSLLITNCSGERSFSTLKRSAIHSER